MMVEGEGDKFGLRGVLPSSASQAILRGVRAGIEAAGGLLELFQESCSPLTSGGAVVRAPNHLFGSPPQQGLAPSEAGGPNTGLSRDNIVAKRVVEELRAAGYELAADCRVFFSVAALFSTQIQHLDARPGVRFGGTLVGGSRAVSFSSSPLGSPTPPPLAFDEDDVYYADSRIRGCIWAGLLARRRKVKKGSGSGGEEGGEDGSRESVLANLRQLYNLVFGGPVLQHGGEPSSGPGVSLIFLLDVTPPPPAEARGAELSADIKRAAEAAEVPVEGLQSLVKKARKWEDFDRDVIAKFTKAKAESRTTKSPKPIEAADLGDKILAIAKGRPRTEKKNLYQAVRNPRKTITIEQLQQNFKYTQEEAADRLGVCSRTVYRACRKHQISWPREYPKKKYNAGA